MDARVVRSKARLQGELVALMDEKPFDEVTVSELCLRAGVSRQTFYSNYSRKEDILLEKLDEIIDSLLAERPKEGFEAFMASIGRLMLENKALLEALFRANLDFHVARRFEKMVNRLAMTNKGLSKNQYLDRFVAGGVFGVMRPWLLTGKDEEFDAIMAIVREAAYRVATIASPTPESTPIVNQKGYSPLVQT